MEIVTLVVGPLETNCHIVVDGNACLVVDPGCEAGRVIETLRTLGVTPGAVVLTHGHVDHALGSRDLARALGVSLMAHPGDAALLQNVDRDSWLVGVEAAEPITADEPLRAGQAISVGEAAVHVLHTPGHSPGSVCLVAEGILLSGDLIFRSGIGRTDLPGGSWGDLRSSLRTVLSRVPPDTVIYPGHGPTTTLRAEREFWRLQGWLE